MDVASVLLFVCVCGLAVYTRNIILYIAACALCLLWGFEIADADLIDGIPVLLCGGYMLYAATRAIWRQ